MGSMESFLVKRVFLVCNEYDMRPQTAYYPPFCKICYEMPLIKMWFSATQINLKPAFFSNSIVPFLILRALIEMQLLLSMLPFLNK